MISRIRGPVLEIGANHAVLDVGGPRLQGLPDGPTRCMPCRPARKRRSGRTSGARGRPRPVRLPRPGGARALRAAHRRVWHRPKTALNILSLVSSETLAGAVRTGSTAHLVKISGIGRKDGREDRARAQGQAGRLRGGRFRDERRGRRHVERPRRHPRPRSAGLRRRRGARRPEEGGRRRSSRARAPK